MPVHKRSQVLIQSEESGDYLVSQGDASESVFGDPLWTGALSPGRPDRDSYEFKPIEPNNLSVLLRCRANMNSINSIVQKVTSMEAFPPVEVQPFLQVATD